MEKFEELIEVQQTIGSEIQTLIRNFKKDPTERKTTDYYKRRLQELEASWSRFQSNDNILRSQQQERKDHEYFTKDLYNQYFQLWEQYKTLFEEKATAPPKPSETRPPAVSNQSAYKAAVSNQSAASTANPVLLMMRRQSEFGKSIKRQLKEIEVNIEMPAARRALLKDSIQRLWVNFEQLHYTIWETEADPTSLGYEMDEFISLEHQVQDMMVEMEEATIKQNNSSTSAVTPSINLPRVTIPKFCGKYMEWKQFHDLFNEVVNKQPLANCQKMFYLKNNLDGDAARLIAHLSISEENYNSAWETLCQRYNNQRLLVNTYIDKLINQPTITNASATTIKQLHDTSTECLLGLKNLGIVIDTWDPFLVLVLTKKLDQTTHNLYEQTVKNPRSLQALNDFLQFLELRFQALEATGTRIGNKACLNTTNGSTTKCAACKEDHKTATCKTYLNQSPDARRKLLLKAKRCVNCLRPGHFPAKCLSQGCMTCKRKHHTSLHNAYEAQGDSQQSSAAQKPSSTDKRDLEQPSATHGATSLTASIPNEPKRSYGLLGTAIITLTSSKGQLFEFRALLDSGSQLNIITERAARKLGLSQFSSPINVSGVGLLNKTTSKRIYAPISSQFTTFKAELEAYVMPAIINNQPAMLLDPSTWPIPKNIKLADDRFHQPGPVDVLIGVELYYDLVKPQQLSLGKNHPILQKTVFGWMVTGRIGEAVTSQMATCGILTNSIEVDLQKFWEVEDVQEDSSLQTNAEQLCEEHFNRTVQRTPEGRFKVKLPFKEEAATLGYSQNLAKLRFYSVERRLSQNYSFKAAYQQFMKEYIELGHMTEIAPNDVIQPSYFLPHHGVIRPDSSTTKLRVVFDGSAKTSTNVSLNDMLETGPTVQDDLFTILSRFRLPKYVFTADIEKMYRQILIDEGDRRFQLIFWRNEEKEPLKVYQLNTVTYGTTSAPYLATKCLQRLAQIENDNHPVAAAILRRDFYVDDVMSGSNSLSEALHAQRELVALLKKGGFNLRKWCSNHPKLLEGLHPSNIAIKLDFNSKDDGHIKTLGQVWIPTSDEFRIQINKMTHEKCTKRTVSSDISRIFDPLGLVSPVTVEAKLFLQHLWTLKLDWDTNLAENLAAKWSRYMESLESLNAIKISRHAYGGEIPNSIQLHAFSDASERAYGGVVYLRSTTTNGRVIVRLLCAKSRLAPLKKLTIPRLELCAAVLTTQLVSKVKRSIQIADMQLFYWTDSEIVLSWINAKSAGYYAFVANRIAKIQETSDKHQWRHVKSKDNPADVLSRGSAAHKLQDNNLWFYGPMFLHGSEQIWPPPFIHKSSCNVERKTTVATLATDSTKQHFVHRIDHHNSFSKLVRIVAYVLRFTKIILKEPVEGLGCIPSTAELEGSRRIIFRLIQQEGLPEDVQSLKTKKEVSKSSAISSLAPFLDNDGLIRVGGRLQASSLTFEAKHPIVLPDCSLTRILLQEVHIKNKHIGPQGLIAIMRQKYWPLKSKILARQTAHKCVACTRAKPTLLNQIMGGLPADRIEPARAFIHSGVDFWGPIWIHHRIRGKRPAKSYIAVFCCFSTKAVHMEVVTDLTTDAFIMALKRFIGRRGTCRKIYCDNATNFVGAKNELGELRSAIFDEPSQEKLKGVGCLYNIDFIFIPARAPHFGGLWEAAVKSAKNLFKRSVLSASLTYEELETLAIEIEAVLNSRPITAVSSNANDLAAITAGHFLIGEPLTATIDVEAKPLQLSLKKRFERVIKLKDEFWQRWRSEYLSHLQQRSKWRQCKDNIKVGQMVLIHEDNTPSLQWPLGRIEEAIVGPDGRVRVAKVRTKNGILTRAIHRLAPLPTETETSHTTPQLSSANCSSIKETPSDIETEVTPRKRKRISSSSALISMLLVCMLTLSNGNPVLEVYNKPGIYFESIGTTNIVSSNWNIIVYYNLTSYWHAWTSIKNATRTLEHLCDESTNHQTCGRIVSIFHQWQRDLELENTLISAQKLRQKRGAFNVIGNVANSLFGVLDSDYEKDMSEKLKQIYENEAELNALLQNHTSIMDATLNIMKRTQEETHRKFTELNGHMHSLTSALYNISNQLQGNTAYENSIAMAIEVLTLTQNLQTQQQTILDTLIAGQHGRIHPMLLSSDQLKDELKMIKGHLPPDLHLPLPDDNILEYYDLIEIKSFITKTAIAFTLKLPLINPDAFELFQLTPIPVLIDSRLVLIKPISSFVALNLQKEQLYPIERSLAECYQGNNNKYLCYQRHPIYRAKASFGRCEMDIFHNKRGDVCKLHQLDAKMAWFQLHNSNQWIYAVSDSSPINLICNDTIEHYTIQNSGRLQIQNNCVLNHDQLIIRSHHIYNSEIHIAYARFSSFPLPNSTFNLPTISYSTTDFSVSLDEIQHLRNSLQHSTLSQIQKHNVHHYALNISTLGILIIIIAIGSAWMYKRKRRMQFPTPAPRSQGFTVNIDELQLDGNN